MSPFLLQILNEIAQHKIKIYEFPECDDEEENKIQKKLRVSRAASWEYLSSGFPTRSDTNWAVQPQKLVRDLKLWVKLVEGLYSSQNKGADQLHSNQLHSNQLHGNLCL